MSEDIPGDLDGRMALGRFKHRKEVLAKDARGLADNIDLVNTVDFYAKDGGPIASVTASRVDRDEMLKIAAIGCAFWAPQRIVCAIDTFKPVGHDKKKVMINPMTGEQWGQHEMQKVFESGEYPGVITEALTVMSVDRDKRFQQWSIDYTRLPAREFRNDSNCGVRVEWGELVYADTNEKGMKLTGIVPEALLAAITVEDRTDEALEHAKTFGIPDTEVRAHIVAAGAKMIMAHLEAAVFLTCPSDDEAFQKVINHSFMDSTMKAWREGVLLAGEGMLRDSKEVRKMRDFLYGSGEVEWNVYTPEDLRKMGDNDD